MAQSVGRTGTSADNAVAEAAWSSLKRELVSRYRFPTRADARRAIFSWINRYNTRRRHSTLGYITPNRMGDPIPINDQTTRPRNQRDRPTGGTASMMWALKVTRSTSSPTHPNYFSQTIERLIETGLPRFRFHDLCHTHASILSKPAHP